jgi:glycosyltransferase involved in cell wall biosynthesis
VKILLVDKNLLDPLHRRKWRALAAIPGVALTAVTPERWVENYREQRFVARPDDGFPIRALPILWPGYENRGIYPGGLDAAVRQERPDVLLAFEEPFSFFALQAGWARARHAPRAALVFHTWNNLRAGIGFGNRPRPLYAAIERWALGRAALLFAANDEARRAYAMRYAPLTVRHLPFGIDLTPFAAAGERYAPSPPDGGTEGATPFTVGYVGRLLPMKGVDTLLEALSRLPDSVRLVLLGDGPDRERLQRLASTLGVADRVDWHAAVPSTEVPDVMASLSALALPSRTTPRWKEQFGRVLVEAMAAGVPVVGSSSGAIPDVLDGAGLVFPEGDAASLAVAIEKLARDAELRTRLITAARRRAENFAPDRFAERVHRELERLLSMNR